MLDPPACYPAPPYHSPARFITSLRMQEVLCRLHRDLISIGWRATRVKGNKHFREWTAYQSVAMAPKPTSTL